MLGFGSLLNYSTLRFCCNNRISISCLVLFVYTGDGQPHRSAPECRLAGRFGLRCLPFLNLVHKVFDGLASKIYSLQPLYHNATDFFHGLLRPDIRWSYHKNDALYKFECMVQHEAFQFLVVLSAPMGAGQKCPTNLNFSFPGFKSEVVRSPMR